MSKFSAELEAKLAPYRAEYQRIVNGWLESGAFGLTYPALLVETFHYVKHSCSLMSQASSNSLSGIQSCLNWMVIFNR